jgi:hypothetical protein
LVGVLAAVLIGLGTGPGTTPIAAGLSPSASAALTGLGSALVGSSPSPELDSSAPSAGLTPAPTVEVTAPTSNATPTPAPSRTPRPTATPSTTPAITSYTAPSVADCSLNGGSITIHLKWSVVRATGVQLSIDGGLFDSYPPTFEVDVPFGCSNEVSQHTYTIQTTGGTGPAATSSKVVKRGAPKIVTFILPTSASCPTSSGSVSITFTWEVKYATGVTLQRDGQTYANYVGQKKGTTIVVYECSNASQTFTLRTLQTFGTEAVKDRVVNR